MRGPFLALICGSVLAAASLLPVSMRAAAAEMPPAGSVVANQAEAMYFNSGLDRLEMLRSNRVEAVVEPAPDLLVLGSYRKHMAPGETVGFAHRIVNSGNVALDLRLGVENGAGDDFDTEATAVFLDNDASGSIGPGDEEIPATRLLPLAPGDFVDIVARAGVPAERRSGEESRLMLSAIAADHAGLDRAVEDWVVVTEGAAVELTKTASTMETEPGAPITYTLSARNNGNAPASGVTVELDGLPVERVVIRDPIPSGVTFLSAAPVAPLRAAFRHRDMPEGSYRTALPGNLADVVEVAFLAEGLAPRGTLMARFDVRAGEAAGTVRNLARLVHADGEGVSQEVMTEIVRDGEDAEIFVGDGDSGRLGPEIVITGRPVFTGVSAPGCNLDPMVQEEIAMTGLTRLAGDEEPLVARETTPSSGYFRTADLPTRRREPGSAVLADAVVDAAGDDTMIFRAHLCDGRELETEVGVDPQGHVFDSRTGTPIVGAEIGLMRMMEDGSVRPAAVFRDSARTVRVGNPLRTDMYGAYDFFHVAPGRYRLMVMDATAGFSFPSARSGREMGALLTIYDDYAAHSDDHPGGMSHGDGFEIASAGARLHPDVPVDPTYDLDPDYDPERDDNLGLDLRKAALQERVEIGDFLEYRLTLANRTGNRITDIVIADRLPFGFAYVEGSARSGDGERAVEVTSEGGEHLFALGALEAGGSLELRFLTRVLPGAGAGRKINRATAYAYDTPPAGGDLMPRRRQSKLATAVVDIDRGIFDDRGVIFGKVFADCDASGLQEAGERGVAGVRIFLQNGRSVVTDENGLYSFSRVQPGTNVLRVDPLSLPEGAAFIARSPRDARGRGTRLAPLDKGEMHRADFALANCAAWPAGEAPTPEAPVASEGEASVTVDTEVMTPELAILSPADGATARRRQVDVLVKGTAGATFDLRVNGEVVGAERVGERTTDSRSGVDLLNFVAVSLREGENRLEVEVFDPFGNSRGVATARVSAPGDLHALVLEPVQESFVADGIAEAEIRVSARDRNGLAVSARTPVTLDAEAGTWVTRDLDEGRPGLQVFVEDGETRVRLRSPSQSRSVRLTAESGEIATETTLRFAAARRALIVAGVLEGQVGVFDFDRSRLDGDEAADGFAKAPRELSVDFGNGVVAGGRVALFLQGQVLGDYLLTVIADTDKQDSDEWLGEIEPDRYYPIYGDSAIGAEAPAATGKLYVRLEKDGSFLQLADFQPTALRARNELSAYRRSIYGLQQRYEGDGFSVESFLSRENETLVVDEFRARGTSGPFRLSRRPVLRDSETVEILVRASAPDGYVLERRGLVRGRDYELDLERGTLILNAPVSSSDPQFNPQFVRVLYEVESEEANDIWIYGGSARVTLFDGLEAGVTATREDGEQTARDIAGVDATITLGEATRLTVETAATRSESAREDDRAGGAGRIEFEHAGEDLEVAFRGAVAEEGFDNPGSPVTSGTATAQLSVGWTLDPARRLLLTVEGEHDLEEELTSLSAEQLVRQQFSPQLAAGLGYRFSGTQVADGEGGERTLMAHGLLATVDFTPDFLPALAVGLYGEQGIDRPSRRRFGVDLEYTFESGSLVWARAEALDGFDGDARPSDDGLHYRWLAGVEHRLLESLAVYSEVRREGAEPGSGEGATGARYDYDFGNGITLDLTAERNFDLDDVAEAGYAVSAVAHSPRSEAFEWSVRGEYSHDDTGNDWLLDTAAGFGIGDSLSVLLRNRTIVEADRAGVDERLKVGLAYRDIDTNRFSGLLGYELRAEPGDDGQEVRHILRADANWRIDERTTLWGQVAGKVVSSQWQDIDLSSRTGIVRGRLNLDLDEDWSVGLSASAYGSDLSNSSFGAGVEVGRRIGASGMLAVGYNHFEYRDRDLNEESHESRGIFVRYRLAFDEKTLGGLLEAFR